VALSHAYHGEIAEGQLMSKKKPIPRLANEPERLTHERKIILNELPHRAIVAFAVRCARRVQPLYELPEEHPFRLEYIRMLDKALGLIEAMTSGKSRIDDRLAAFEAVQAARYPAARYAADQAGDGHDAVKSACAAEDAIAVAANDAGEYAHEDASRAAAQIAANIADCGATAAALADDLQQLQELRQSCSCPDPFDPSESGPLGPLWPDGIPDWYREKRIKLNQLLGLPKNAWLHDNTTSPDNRKLLNPQLSESAISAEEAFKRDLPELLEKYPDHVVAYYDGKRWDIDRSLDALMERCMKRCQELGVNAEEVYIKGVDKELDISEMIG